MDILLVDTPQHVMYTQPAQLLQHYSGGDNACFQYKVMQILIVMLLFAPFQLEVWYLCMENAA